MGVWALCEVVFALDIYPVLEKSQYRYVQV